MKRVFAMIIALVMIAVLSVSVSAGIEPYGKTNDDGTREAVPVPKVTTAPAVDGSFDAVYNERSLVIPITRDSNGEGEPSPCPASLNACWRAGGTLCCAFRPLRRSMGENQSS